MPAAASSDIPPSAAYRVTLPEFEGPLDLLLHLCQTHELDILNISIAFIAQKYIEYLEQMEGMSVEIAAEYLVMAAHLAYLKSRELVPTPEPLEAGEDGEEVVDPREELIRRLLEYSKYKNAAQNLSQRPIEGRNVFVRGVPLEGSGEAGLAEHSIWKLLEHWSQILEKAKPQYTHDVVVDRISISDRINEVVDLLEAGNGMVRFEDLLGHDLPETELRHKVVVSLLAVLELARLRVIRVLQDEATGAFFLAQVEGAGLAEARNAKVTSARDPSADEEPAGTEHAVAESLGVAPEPTEAVVELAPEPAGASSPSAPGPTEAVVELAAELAEARGEVSIDPVETVVELAPEPAETRGEASIDPVEAVVELAPESAETRGKASIEPAETVVELTPESAEACAASAAEPVDVVMAALAREPEEASAFSAPPPVAANSYSEVLSGDPLEISPQDVVSSAPFPALDGTGEQASDGQTQEEHKQTAE